MEPLTETDTEHDYCPDSAIKLSPEAKQRKNSIVTLPNSLFRRKLSSYALLHQEMVCMCVV